MNTIKTVFTWLAGLVASFAPNANIVTDIVDGVTYFFQNAGHITPAVAIPAVIMKDIGNVEATLTNLGTGQAAQLYTVSDYSYNGAGDDVLIFAVRKYRDGQTPPQGSFAETVKTALGY